MSAIDRYPGVAHHAFGWGPGDWARFWDTADRTESGCVTSSLKIVRIQRTISSEKRSVLPQVVAWTFFFGPAKNGSKVISTCGTATCLNPDHLDLIARDIPTPTVKRLTHIDRPSQSRKVRVGNDLIPAFYTSQAWKELRNDVIARDHGICQYCGCNGRMADHIEPRGQGGLDVLQNLVCCCRECNRVAGGRTFDSFDAKKSWILSRRAIAV